MLQPGEYILDRIEGALALLEGPDGATQPLPLEHLPGPLREGDCLVWDGAAWRLDPAAAEARRARIQARVNRLFRKD